MSSDTKAPEMESGHTPYSVLPDDGAPDRPLRRALTLLVIGGLILTNTGDDIYYAAQRALKLRADFHYEELEGGTHDIVEEQPDAWTDAVVNFLKS